MLRVIEMVKRRVYQNEKHVHFVTFSCYRRRQLLSLDSSKRILIGQLGSRLVKHSGICTGFVIMPDHVHALLWFPEPGELSSFMNHWKDQSSRLIKESLNKQRPEYLSRISLSDPVWQARYYGFNIWSRKKLAEKLEYIHLNPVRAGIVEKAVEWKWGSARWYEIGKSAGLPINWPPGMETDDEFVVGE